MPPEPTAGNWQNQSAGTIGFGNNQTAIGTATYGGLQLYYGEDDLTYGSAFDSTLPNPDVSLFVTQPAGSIPFGPNNQP